MEYFFINIIESPGKDIIAQGGKQPSKSTESRDGGTADEHRRKNGAPNSRHAGDTNEIPVFAEVRLSDAL